MTEDPVLPPPRPAADTAVPGAGPGRSAAADDPPSAPAANDRRANDCRADDRRADGRAAARSDDAFIIEVADEAPGLVVRARGGFRFVAADSRYASLDGRLFRDPASAERAARDLHRRRAG